LVGLTVWLVLSIWALFGAGAYVGLIMAMITLFFLVLVGIPLLIWLTWRRNTPPRERHDLGETFGEWSAHAFHTWTGPLSGRAAAIQILLPIAAVSFGMTVFGLVYYFAVPQVGS
jgi:hypothetical protein